MTLYLSRLTLSREPAARALDALINPDAADKRMDAHHRLLWTLFSDGPDRRRDFLWRDEGAGRFMTLSARPPAANDLFAPPEVKVFSPVLSPGDRLEFVLRVNATRTEKTGSAGPSGAERKRHIDLVMDALHAIPVDQRAEKRDRAAQEVAQAWMAGQGARAGFELLGVQADGYGVTPLPGQRGPRARQAQFGILDLSGALRVIDPAAFLARLVQGFGRAKAFGCGLMLIRRG